MVESTTLSTVFFFFLFYFCEELCRAAITPHNRFVFTYHYYDHVTTNIPDMYVCALTHCHYVGYFTSPGPGTDTRFEIELVSGPTAFTSFSVFSERHWQSEVYKQYCQSSEAKFHQQDSNPWAMAHPVASEYALD